MCALSENDSELHSLRSTFYDEADERLLELEALLLELDGRSVDPERMNSVFRAVHSIKGGSAACELVNVVRFAHTFESLLDALRKERMSLNAEVVNVMLQSSDVLASLVHSSRNGDMDAEWGAADAVERIRSVLDRATEPVPGDVHDQTLSSRGVMFFEDDHPPPVLSRPSLRSLRAPASLKPSLRAVSVPAHAFTAQVAAAHEPSWLVPDDEQEQTSHANIPESDLSRMVALAIDLQQSSVRLAEQLSAGSERAVAQLAETSRQIASEVGELESLLTAARGGDSATLLECIVVRLDASLYAIPLTAVGRYFTFVAEDLRTIPRVGGVLVSGAEMLPVIETQLTGEQTVCEPRERVAISLSLTAGPAVLLVDEVLTQVKLLVRKLESNYRTVPGVLGAAPYGSRVLLVLDPENLSGRTRPS